MDLVQVDGVDAEALEAGVRLAHDRVALQAVHDRAVGALEERALREHIWPLGHALEGAPHDLLRMAEAVGRRRVDPVDPCSSARCIAAMDSSSS